MPTSISDLWIPDIWLATMREKQATLPSLLNSGVAVDNPKAAELASGPGEVATIPFFKDITDQDDELQVENAEPAVDNKITSGLMKAIACNRVTATQSARIAGFRTLLAVRGHSLRLGPSGPEVPALLQPATNEKGEYQLAEETSVTDIVSILREDLPTAIQPGAILTEGAAQYRVIRAQDHPVDVAVRFHCQAVIV